MDDGFDAFPSWVVTEQPDFYENWSFMATLDEDEAEEEGEEYGHTHEPMWSTWFIPDDTCIRRFIEENPEEVMDCGFTLIYDKDDDFFALGVDDAGYSFRDTHFTRLYDAEGLHWHDEPEEEQESQSKLGSCNGSHFLCLNNCVDVVNCIAYMVQSGII